MDYDFLKRTQNGLEEFCEMISEIEKIAEEEIDRGYLGKGTALYEVRNFFGEKTHIELEPVTIGLEPAKTGEEECIQEGVYVQIHTFRKIPRKIRRILSKQGYEPISIIRD